MTRSHPAARLHKFGTRDQPRRDVFGIDDRTMGEAREVIRNFGRSLLSGGPSSFGHALIKRF